MSLFFAQLANLIVLALVVSLCSGLSSAAPALLWSDNPGAFEQHLLRRHESPLFPKNRRTVTQSEINIARQQDHQDYKELNDRMAIILEKIGSLPEKSNYSPLDEIRVSLENLILDAMGVGGKAYDIATKAKLIRNELISSMNEFFSDRPTEKALLLEAEAYYQAFSEKIEVSYIMHLSRKNKPIPNSEVIPALITEEPDAIAKAMIILSQENPQLRPLIQKEAVRIINAALDEGAKIENLNEVLAALEVHGGVEGKRGECERVSRVAIASGNTTREFCYGRIDPSANHHELTVLDDCLAKGQKTLALLAEAEKMCSNEGEETLDEITEYRGHITKAIRTVDLLKRIELGSASDDDLLEELLRQMGQGTSKDPS